MIERSLEVQSTAAEEDLSRNDGTLCEEGNKEILIEQRLLW